MSSVTLMLYCDHYLDLSNCDQGLYDICSQRFPSVLADAVSFDIFAHNVLTDQVTLEWNSTKSDVHCYDISCRIHHMSSGTELYAVDLDFDNRLHTITGLIPDNEYVVNCTARRSDFSQIVHFKTIGE